MAITPLLAQVTGGLGIIDNSVQQLEAVQQAWDARWQDIFASSSGLYLGINQFAAVILVGAFLFFATGWVKEAIERGIFPSLPNVLWVLTIAVLLFNNGALLGSATLGIRNLINSQTQTVLQVQVGEISMMEALNDVILPTGQSPDSAGICRMRQQDRASPGGLFHPGGRASATGAGAGVSCPRLLVCRIGATVEPGAASDPGRRADLQQWRRSRGG